MNVRVVATCHGLVPWGCTSTTSVILMCLTTFLVLNSIRLIPALNYVRWSGAAEQ
jgi:hypothetical protein